MSFNQMIVSAKTLTISDKQYVNKEKFTTNGDIILFAGSNGTHYKSPLVAIDTGRGIYYFKIENKKYRISWFM